MIKNPNRFSLTKCSTIIFEDEFDAVCLDRSKWLPSYLPHWTAPNAAEARYKIENGFLRLFIAKDQLPWLPELEGSLKVSSLQTGHFSGPLGSRIGQHRSCEGLFVQAELTEMRLFVPLYCQLEMRARTQLNPWNLAALWLIGFEDQPEFSGEITIFEAFGSNASPGSAQIGRGIKRVNDPNLADELDESELPIALNEWHEYAIDWSANGVEFYVDDLLVTRSAQSPDYPMQIMLNLYDLPGEYNRSNQKDAWFDIDFIRAYGRG